MDNLGTRELYRAFLGTKFWPEQVKAEQLADIAKILLILGGERAGKSFLAATLLGEDIYISMLNEHKNGLWWIVGPDYERTHQEFKYLQDQLTRWGILVPSAGNPSVPQAGKWRMYLEMGHVLETWSTDEFLKLAGTAPDGILMTEPGLQQREAWERLADRSAEKDAKIYLAGTYESANRWYIDLYRRLIAENDVRGYAVKIPSWSNRIAYPLGRNDPGLKLLENLSGDHERFMERFGAEPSSPHNLVHRNFNSSFHVRTFDYNPDLPLEIAVDPGWSSESAYAVLFIQYDPAKVVGKERVYVLDEVYEPGSTTRAVIELCKAKPWWKDVTGGTIDVASLQSIDGNKVAEVWWQETGLPLRTKWIRIQDGIDRMDSLLSPQMKDDAKKPAEPKLIVHPRAKNLIEEFGEYKWAEGSDSVGVKRTPVDRKNHGIKALTYAVVDIFGFVADTIKRIWTIPFAWRRKA